MTVLPLIEPLRKFPLSSRNGDHVFVDHVCPALRRRMEDHLFVVVTIVPIHDHTNVTIFRDLNVVEDVRSLLLAVRAREGFVHQTFYARRDRCISRSVTLLASYRQRRWQRFDVPMPSLELQDDIWTSRQSVKRLIVTEQTTIVINRSGQIL